MDNIVNLGKVATFPVEGEVAKRVGELIEEYADRISLVAMVGILELAKQQLLSGNYGTNT